MPQRTLEFASSDLITLAPAAVERTIPLTGTLKATNQTLVRAKVSGELVELAVREGTAVQAGQRIARIDPTEFEARVREREAQRRSAEAQEDQARRTMENNRKLLDRSFISQNAFDNAQSGYQVAVANRDAAVAQLAQARKALADTAVLAPMSGVVAERFAQVGEKVSPDSRILTIVDLSRMEIEAHVPASEIGSVRVGQPVTLRVEGIEAPQTGEVVRISPSTAAGTRSVPVYIGLDNRDPRIRAGLFAQGALAVERHDDVLAVPVAALRDAAGRTFVYRVVDGLLEERPVTTGLRDPSARAANGSTGVVEVLEGLKAGDTIVGVNLGTLRAGSKVRIGGQPPAAQAGAAERR
jgi:RND family efflux transporter MFP subunit